MSKVKVKPTNTISFAELKRLSFCNSKKMPTKVVALGKVIEWTGIGWIETGEKPDKNMTVVVEP
jgi:hypothetical protein